MAGLVSADSHVMEPGDLWEQRLDRKFVDDSPRVIADDEGTLVFTAPGVRSMPLAMGVGIGRNGQSLHDFLHSEASKKGGDAFQSGTFDAEARLKDQDVDGVVAEVMLTTLGQQLFGLKDLELQRACFAIYNDYVSEYCSYNPKRLYGVGLISLGDISLAVKEAQRCAKLGYRALQVWAVAPAEHPYFDPIYDPFWNAAQELQLPLVMHVATGSSQPPSTVNFEFGSMQMLMGRMGTIHEIQKTILALLFGGVFDRFPGLRVISGEHDAGWAAHMVHRMDRQYEKWASNKQKVLKLKPSGYFRRNIYFTFQDDNAVGATAHVYGQDNFLWGSDYPHSDATWPHSREVISNSFKGVPGEIVTKITRTNAAKLFRIDLPY